MKLTNILLILMLATGAYGADIDTSGKGAYIDPAYIVKPSPKPDCTCKEIYEALKDLESIVRTADDMRKEAGQLPAFTPGYVETLKVTGMFRARDVLTRCEKYFVEKK